VSEENLEIVREAFRRFEASDLEGGIGLWHPDSWITGPAGWPEPGPFRGRDAVFAQFGRLTADWKEIRVPDVEVVADNGDWIVVTFRWDVRGDRSGAATGANLAAAFRLTEGRISEAHFRWTGREALEAAGLAEQ
jgi:ketosteroid isomerase-like protein